MGTKTKLNTQNNYLLKPMTDDWVGGTIADRIRECIAMLAIHGFLTDQEKERIKGRYEKRMGRKNREVKK